MRLELKDVFESGVAVLDSGITDIKVAVIDGVVQIYSTTGRNGGVTAYQLDAQGNVTLATTVIFPPEITLSVGDKLIFSQTSAGQVLYIGDNARGLFGLSAEAGGLGEVTDSDWGLLQAMSNGGSIAVGNAITALLEGLGEQTVIEREWLHQGHTAKAFVGAGSGAGGQQPVALPRQSPQQGQIV